jgi:hypothetical protein
MIIWIDAQLSPAIAAWPSSTFSVEAIAVRDLQLREAKDRRNIQCRAAKQRHSYDEGQRLSSASRATRTASSSYLDNFWEYFQRAVERNPYRRISKSE